MKLAIAALVRFWPIFILLCFEIILFLTNYTPGTYLLGWDNVTPEFGFPLHFMRSLFGVWQENRGLGLYDGMSHVANLLHTLFLSILSFGIPQHLLRYTFIFSMHFLGGTGMFFLLKKLFDKHKHHAPQGLACIGALFYLYNLITIQMFFAPLEAFAVHFAALPWLALTLSMYLQDGHKRSLMYFLLASFLSTPQYFVTTLFLPTTISIFCFSLAAIISSQTMTTLRRIGLVTAGFFLVNTFWLLPYIVGLPTNAPTIANAKINQMSTEEVFSRNKAFGNLSDVLFLRGYALDFEDQGTNGTYGYMMAPWRDHINLPTALVISSLAFAFVFFGVLVATKKQHRTLVPFIFIFFIGLVFLANDTPGINTFTNIFREKIPFFAEAFRFPFTKFSLLFVFSYTILLTAGISKFFSELESRPKHLSYAAVAIIGIAILLLGLPAFKGNFIYQNLRIKIPDDYLNLFAYMKSMDPNKRVAILPQPAYWSWKFYEFGYRGSGFLWQGMPQPTLDRAFDPWSQTSENYYWELSRALYGKDSIGLTNVLDKYDISYILLDEHLESATTNRALFIDEGRELLANIPEIKFITAFGKISIYERQDTSRDFVTIASDVPTVNPYSWTDNDIAYQELGNYITGEGITYPFRSLFTKRAVSERDFTIKETFETLDIGSLAEATSASVLKQEALAYDSVALNDTDSSSVVQCGLLKNGSATASNPQENGRSFLRFESLNQRGCLSFGIPDLSHRDGYLVAVENRHMKGRPLLFSIINQTAKHVELETYLGMDTSWKTDYFVLPPLAPDGLGYNLYISNDSIGNKSSINDLGSIRIYKIPYNDLVHERICKDSCLPAGRASSSATPRNDLTVYHPNPAYYKITMDNKQETVSTLILSQSYDKGWLAYDRANKKFLDHVLVNNWANGWTLNNGGTIYIFFWPQLLQFLGFALLPIPFIWALRKNR